MEYAVLKVYGHETYGYRKELRENKFEFIKKSYGKSYWMKKYLMTSEELSKLDNVKVYWKKKGLDILVLYPNNMRSSDYRKEFLNKNKGIKGYYFCAYCGAIMNTKKLTVDHIFPVDRTAKSKFLKKILSIMKINNINDIRNLTPCCKSCNSRKGSKTGLWIIRGLIGRYRFTWPITWIIIILLFFVIFCVD